MPSTSIYLKGKTKFSFTSRLNQYGKWVVGLYPDADSLTQVKELISEGIKNELKKDDEGYWIAFSCPPDKTDRQGRKFLIQPPVVVDADGRALSEPIGNGSDVSVKLEIYGGKTPVGSNYKAARLRGVKVHTLIPYMPEHQAQDEFEQKTAAGLNQQTAPVENW